ncbi:MAG: hypothetical protein AB2L12_06220 [Smithellaceae bacterium]
MQAKSSTGKSNIMSRLVDEMVTDVSGQFRGADSPGEQTKEHSEEQSLKQTVNQTDSQTLSQANSQSIRRTGGRSINQSSELPKEQSEEYIEKQTIKHSKDQSIKQGHSETHILTAVDRSSPPFAHFTERQSTVLAFMIHSKNKYITLDYIAYATGLPYASVRTVIRTLRQYKYVLSTGRSRHLKTQYLHYELDEIRCKQFWEEIGVFYDFNRPLRWNRNGLIRSLEIESVEQTKEHTEEQSNKRTFNQTDSPTVKQTDLLSSSIFNTKLLLIEISETFATHPDFAFWIEEKLESATVLRWIDEFSDIPIKVEDMLLYLSRCSYDLTTLNKKASLKNTPVNYFYGCIKRNKTYLPPQGFKTLEERILEDKRKIVEELESRVRELQELEEKEKQANIEIKFREMMREETGELYNTCLNNIPAVFKNSDRSGPGFKTAMKQVFMKSEIVDQINGGV